MGRGKGCCSSAPVHSEAQTRQDAKLIQKWKPGHCGFHEIDHPDVNTPACICDINNSQDFEAYIKRQERLEDELKQLQRQVKSRKFIPFEEPVHCVRPFLSSTFRDFDNERNVLMKSCFPRLEKTCAERGVFFAPLDLRWGVTSEQSASGEVIRLCLEEIDRSHPYFICSLGHRNGWTLSAEYLRNMNNQGFEDTTIAQDPGQKLLKDTFDVGAQHYPWVADYLDRSVTEIEVLHGALNDPDNASRALFYFRDVSFLKQAKEEERKFLIDLGWNEVKVSNLKRKIISLGLPVRWFSRAEDMARHIHEDMTKMIDFDCPPEDNAAEGMKRVLRDHLSFAKSRARVFVENEVMNQLDAFITESNTHASESNIENKKSKGCLVTGNPGSGKSSVLSNFLIGCLEAKRRFDPSFSTVQSKSAMVLGERNEEAKQTSGTDNTTKGRIEDNTSTRIEKSMKKKAKGQSKKKKKQNINIAKSSSSTPSQVSPRLPRLPPLPSLPSLPNRPKRKSPNAVPPLSKEKPTHERNCSQLSPQQDSKWRDKRIYDENTRDWSSTFIIYRFIGCTSASSNASWLVKSIVYEIRGLLEMDHIDIPDDVAEVVETFPSWLSKIEEQKCSLILILDGLEHLQKKGQGNLLNWLPRTYSDCIRILVSASKGSEPYQQCVQFRHFASLEISPLDRETRDEIQTRFLSQYGKELDKKQAELVVDCKRTECPLYLTTFLQEIRTYGNYDLLNERILHFLEAQSVQQLFVKVLQVIHLEFAQTKVPSLVQRTLCLLAVSREGLSDSELKSTLEMDLGLSIVEKTFPSQDFNTLMLRLAPMLIERGGIQTFNTSHFKEAVTEMFFQDESDRLACYETLANYFSRQENGFRRTEELPFHFYTLIKLYSKNGRFENEQKCQYWCSQLRDFLINLDSFALLTRSQNSYDLHKYWAILERASKLSRSVAELYSIQLKKSNQESKRSQEEIALICYKIGEFLVTTKRMKGAGSLLQRALALYEEIYDPYHVKLLPVLRQMALMESHLNQYAQALNVYQRSSLILQKQERGHKSSLLASVIRVEMATLCMHLGKYKEAHLAYQEAMKIQLQNKSINKKGRDAVVAETKTNLASLYLKQHRVDQALHEYEEALTLMQMARGHQHPDTASVLSSMAACQIKKRHPHKAIEILQRSLNIKESVFGEHHLALCTVLNNLGSAHFMVNQLDKASEIYQRLVDLRRTLLGVVSDPTALSYRSLAKIYLTKGEDGDNDSFDKARQYYLQAVASFGVDPAQILTGINKSSEAIDDHVMDTAIKVMAKGKRHQDNLVNTLQDLAKLIFRKGGVPSDLIIVLGQLRMEILKLSREQTLRTLAEAKGASKVSTLTAFSRRQTVLLINAMFDFSNVLLAKPDIPRAMPILQEILALIEIIENQDERPISIHFQTIFNLGYCYVQERKISQAITKFQSVVSDFPSVRGASEWIVAAEKWLCAFDKEDSSGDIEKLKNETLDRYRAVGESLDDRLIKELEINDESDTDSSEYDSVDEEIARLEAEEAKRRKHSPSVLSKSLVSKLHPLKPLSSPKTKGSRLGLQKFPQKDRLFGKRLLPLSPSTSPTLKTRLLPLSAKDKV